MTAEQQKDLILFAKAMGYVEWVRGHFGPQQPYYFVDQITEAGILICEWELPIRRRWNPFTCADDAVELARHLAIQQSWHLELLFDPLFPQKSWSCRFYTEVPNIDVEPDEETHYEYYANTLCAAICAAAKAILETKQKT